MKYNACLLLRRIAVLSTVSSAGWAATITLASGGSADLFQARNGTPIAPTSPVAWVKGDAGPSNSHYVEGYSVPYRMVMTGLAPGHHNLLIEWEIKDGGKNATDYLTHYNRLLPHNQFGSHTTPEAIYPLDGLSGPFGDSSTFAMPAPSGANSPVPGQPTASFNALSSGERVMTIWNGTITSLSYTNEGDLSASSAATELSVDFTTTNTTVVIAWGGHIATRLDWGAGNSAASISGALYHMRKISLDGGGGNQDRSLQALAVVSPPTCMISGPHAVCPGTTNAYSVVTDATDEGTVYSWSLTNNTSGASILGPADGSSVQISSGVGGYYAVQVMVSADDDDDVPELGGGPNGSCLSSVAVKSNTTTTPLNSQTVCPRTTVVFSTVPSGTEPIAFVWSKDGVAIAGATNNSLTLASVNASDAGLYCVDAIGPCGTASSCAGLSVEALPVITCPPDLTRECFGDVPPPDPSAVGVTGGSGALTVLHAGDFAQTNGCEIVIKRAYQVMDSCGSMARCTQTITVVDTIPPVITCLPDRTVECGTAWDFDLPSASDLCDGTNVTITIAGTATNGLCGNTFAATRTWRATDSCSNSATCIQTITVVDTIPPLITCLPDRTVECGAAWDFDLPSASDLCDGTNVTITLAGTATNGLCGNTFAATRTWRATDSCSNSATCTQTITVVDTTSPVITCLPDRTVECGAVWDFDLPSASDICDETNVTINIAGTTTNGLCGHTFAATRTWRATDSCSNSATCTQTITVVDTTPPVLICRSDRDVECGATWDFDMPSATDICGDANVSITIVGTVTNALKANLFSATRTWMAIDACGNSAICAQTVTLVDTTPPQIACSTNITAACAGPAGTQVFFTTTATDLCDTNVQVVCMPPSGTLFSLGDNIVTCLATDASGNRSQCSFTVTVQDTVPPQIVCPADITAAEDPPGSGVAMVSYPAPTATDNCDPSPVVVCAPPSGAPLPLGDNTIRCTAMDGSGNTNACSFKIKVVPYAIVANNTDDAGPGTLRQALLDANAAPGTNVIAFNFPGPPPYTIHLLSPLPPITDTVIIDGWSEITFTGTPVVQLDGSNAVSAVETFGGVDGLVISSGGSTVRGLVLNGFAMGIRVQAGGNAIQGNFIGTDPTGTIAPGNSGDGIYVTSAGNLIGGTGPGGKNIISGNRGNGLRFDTPEATSNVVQGNFIGTASDGVSPLGNGQNGVMLGEGAAANFIGSADSDDGNVIAFNGATGVALDLAAGVGNAIHRNSIASNGALGIDLGGDGVTANDPGDTDVGPNNLQNFPVLIAAKSFGNTTTIDGALNSAPSTAYQLEFFLNAMPDPSGFGEGQTFLATAMLRTDRSGSQSFTVTLPNSISAGQFITATATDPANNTSEFSQAVEVTSPPTILLQPAGTNAPLGASVILCVTASGSLPLFFQWRHNGQNIPDATNRCYTIPSSQLADGGTYTVLVANGEGAISSDPVLLLFQLPPIPAGDNFADRVALFGTNGTAAGTNLFATREPGEPNHAGKPGGSSVWYTWTAPATGIATFRTTGSTFDTLLGVYTGLIVSNLTTVASDEDRGGFFTSQAQFNAVAGTAYQIAIDGFGGAAGNFVFGWHLEVTTQKLPVITTQPVSQTAAPGSSVTFTVAATGGCGGDDDECNEPDGDEEGRTALTYQWYLNGSLISGATQSTFTVTDVQPNTLGNYTVQVKAGTRAVESLPASLQINVTGLEVQSVQAMDKFLDAADQANPLRLGNAPAGAGPAGPVLAAAGFVRGYTGTQVFNTAGSTTQPGEEPICGVLGGASQWFPFVPAESGQLFLNTDGSSYDTVMAVFVRSATNSAGLQLVACDDNSGTNGKTSSLSVPVQAGKTNYIVVDGVGGATGVLQLNYSLDTPTTLTSLGITAQDAYHLRLAGRPGLKFTLQKSADLINWSSLLTTNTPSGLFDFIDPSSPAPPNRYYRALLLP